MRKPRLAPLTGGFYHITSRVMERAKRLDTNENERMRILLWQMSAFTGVQVLTHALLGNHFHLLLEVPAPPECPLPEAEVIHRLSCLPPTPSTGISPGTQLAREIFLLRKSGTKGALIEAKLDRVRERMFSLVRFMQEFKQRFTQDFNRRHSRKGTLWEERYRSTLLEPQPETLLRVAAYIDLNPLRANLVHDPKDYRFCGYGAAVSGHPESRQGLIRLFVRAGLLENETTDDAIEKAMALYRLALFGQAQPREETTKRNARAGLSDADIQKVLNIGGNLGLAEQLRCRLKFISEGIVLGSPAFVAEHIPKWVQRLGRRRKLEPQITPMEGWTTLNPCSV